MTSRVCSLRDVVRRRVRSPAASAAPSVQTARGEYPASSVAEIAAFRAGEPLPGEEVPASLTQERTLLVRAQREKAELDLAERRGELQSRADNEAKAAAMATDARKRMLAVPERVAGRFGLPREVIEGIAEEIRDALVELSTRGPSIPPSPRPRSSS